MTREEALNEIKSWDFLEGKEIEAIHTLIPELRKSEDERILRVISEAVITFFSDYANDFEDEDRDAALAWLEKHKEPENTSASTMAPSCWEVEQKEQKPKAKAKSPLSPHELYDAKIEGISQGRQDVLDHPEQFGLQKPAEWSEEDEKMINSIINVVCGVGSQPNGLREKQVSFLKSLRPSWKPSEEQMKYLLMLADYFESEGGTSNAKTLREFHEQLRKL